MKLVDPLRPEQIDQLGDGLHLHIGDFGTVVGDQDQDPICALAEGLPRRLCQGIETALRSVDAVDELDVAVDSVAELLVVLGKDLAVNLDQYGFLAELAITESQ